MYKRDYMQRAIDLAREGMLAGYGGPFGCVIVKNGEIVGEAHNEVLSSNDPTAHAELLAIRRASQKLRSFNLSGCELYTNGAPCCMCMSSMLWARIDCSYYALGMDASAAIGLGDEPFYQELARPLNDRRIIPMILQSDLADEAQTVYQSWATKRDRVQF
jgi:guanine deaminase